MYAVIESGGKQHRVEEGEILRLEKINAETGETVSFDKVLMMGEGDSAQVGAPYVGAVVEAEVIEQGRGDKVKIIKFRRRKHHRKQMGHRQDYTAVKIVSIKELKKASKAKAKAEVVEDATTEAAPAKKTVTKKVAPKKDAKVVEEKPVATKKTSAKNTAADTDKPAKKPAAKKPAAKKATTETDSE